MYVSLMGEVQVRLQLPTPTPWGMVQPDLWGTSPPPGGFASTGPSDLLVCRHPSMAS